MKKRFKMRRHDSERKFSHGADRMHKRNLLSASGSGAAYAMRGGIRL